MPAFTDSFLHHSHVISIQLFPFIFVNTRLLQKGGWKFQVNLPSNTPSKAEI